MTTIARADLVQSVADALQYISYYHPADYIRALGRAYEREQSPAAKDAIAQILTNSRMCAEGHRPICQDTGIVNVFVKMGMEVRFDFQDFEETINEGVRRAYLDPDNKLRASLLDESDFGRRNTKDNTPAVINVQLVPGDTGRDATSPPKAAARRAKSKFAMLNPVRLDRRLGAEDRADDGRRLVPAGNARHRHRRHRREGDAARQGSR